MTSAVGTVSVGYDTPGPSAATIVGTKAFAANDRCTLLLGLFFSQTVSSVADDGAAPATWTFRGTLTENDFGARWEVWTSTALSVGTLTVTATLSAACTDRSMLFIPMTEVSTFDKYNSQKQLTPGTGTDAVTSTATASLTSQPALIVGISTVRFSNTAPAAGTGFTDNGSFIQQGLGTDKVRVESKRVTATTGVAATFTAGTDITHCSFVLAFTETVTGVNNAIFYIKA